MSAHNELPAAAQEPVPAFYLHSSDWNSVLVPMTPHRDVRAYRHRFDHSNPEDLVPVYAAPVAAAPGIDVTCAARIAELEAQVKELDRLCDATYVAQGADAYSHACDMLEQFQTARAAAGKEIGTEGSLCDGMAWLYDRLDELEAQSDASPKGGEHFQDRLAEIEGRPRPEPEGDEVEEVVACLGDDAAAMLDENPEDERALNMQRAAELLTELQDSPKGGSDDAWRSMDAAPKSVADGNRVEGVYLLGFIPDDDLVDPQACIDVIWWEPLLPNSKGGRGKWCANRYSEACEVAPTKWQHLPNVQATSAEVGS